MAYSILINVHFTRVFFLRLLHASDYLTMAFALLWVWVCGEIGWKWEYTPTLLMGAAVFPLAFVVNSAYGRREIALQVCGAERATSYVFIMKVCLRTPWPQGILWRRSFFSFHLKKTSSTHCCLFPSNRRRLPSNYCCTPPPPCVQRTLCPTNTSVWTVFFWDLID